MSRLTPLTTATTRRPEPTSVHAEVLHNRRYTDHYRRLQLYVPTIAVRAQPGQFVMLTAARNHEAGPVLPRPMAIYTRSADTGMLEIVYGVVGDGTRALSTFNPGERLTVTGPLGQGFILGQTERILLLGRGIGTCSLTTVAQDLADTGTEVVAVASGRTPASIIGADIFRECGARPVWQVNDADGTSNVTALQMRLLCELHDRPPHRILTCGAQRLTQLSEQLAARWGASVQVSVEAHMACGIGYCHGCAVADTVPRHGEEPPLVCRDGPVFALTGVTGVTG